MTTSSKKIYAYVWLLMKGDRYAPGLIISAFSIKKTNPAKNIDFVAMVTNDVSKEVIKELKKIMDKVIIIDYIKKKSNNENLTKRQTQLYIKWISSSYTKWNCLSLYKYKKILLIDADIVIVKNIDSLFKIIPPAGVFHNYWSNHHIKNSKIKEYFLEPKENQLKHNILVDKMSIYKGLNKNGFVINGGLVLLKPSKKYFTDFKGMLTNIDKFGFNSYSGVDEQSIVFFMQFYNKGPKKRWRNINKIYNSIASKEFNKNKINYKIRAIHYMGEELPWESGAWDDLVPFFYIAKEGIKKLKLNLKNLNFQNTKRFYKKYKKEKEFLKLFEYYNKIK